MVFWRERGGTPFALHPKLAPIAVTPGMMLWLRIDEELIGGTDDAGCYHRPEALDIVLRWYEEPIFVWLESVAGYRPAPSRDHAFRVARRLLRCLGSGRADSRSEDLQPDDD